MELPRVIGLYSSRPQCGKSIVAGWLSELGYVRRCFAMPLKRMVATLLGELGCDVGAIEAMVNGDRKAEPIPALAGASPRYLMQTLGTGWGRRMVDADVWVNAALPGVLWGATKSVGPGVVVDDMRFPNEAKALLSLRGEGTSVQLWRIERARAEPSAHASEGQLDRHRFDVTIDNDFDTLDELRDSLERRGLLPKRKDSQ